MNETQRRCCCLSSIGLLLAMAFVVTMAKLSIDPASVSIRSSEMALVPAGEFAMGTLTGHPDEQPRHRVYLDAFYIDRHDVTNEQYLHFMQSATGLCQDHVCLDTQAENSDSHIIYRGGRYAVEAGYEQHPVTLVSWYGAQAYCQHHGKRLPSEAEWEKAARGLDGRRYPWGEAVDRARLNADGRVGDTTPVGSYPGGTSPYGAYDLAGNVWEWTADW